MLGKRLKNAHKSIDSKKVYSLNEAVKLVKTNATAKFDETVEIAINLNVDAKKAEQNIRGVLSLPNGWVKRISKTYGLYSSFLFPIIFTCSLQI